MPMLSSKFQDLLAGDETLPLAGEIAKSLNQLSLAQLREVAHRAVDLLGSGVGWMLLEMGLTPERIPAPLTVQQLQDDEPFCALRDGQQPLQRGAQGSLVRLCQRGLQALAARSTAGAPGALALPRWGADGGFGEETEVAILAFRAWRGVGRSEDRCFDAELARLVVRDLGGLQVPQLFPPQQVYSPAADARQRIVEIARGICEATADAPFVMVLDNRRYSYEAQHFGRTTHATASGRLRAPGGISYGLRADTEDYWKCNIFGGVVLSLARLPVPVHQLSGSSVRHYPRAERFGPALAKKRHWTLVRHLDHRDPEDPWSSVEIGPAQQTEIRELLGEVLPGDLLLVDHPGEPGDDGGHIRVCVAAAQRNDGDVAPLFAQARQQRAVLQRDGLSLMQDRGELQYWLLRHDA